MSIKVFVHTLSKRAETSALLDTGATENFINEAYVRLVMSALMSDPHPHSWVFHALDSILAPS